MRANHARCRVLDLGAFCVLQESLAAFQEIGIPACCQPGEEQYLKCYIIPGAGALTDHLARRLSALVASGRWLIFESAAGFSGFESQREMLARHFGLSLQPPLDLWAQDATVPYVDYTWPVKTKIRDFSRMVPLSAQTDGIIGSINAQPVAVRRGRLIFLGSPIGPALLAGDREAHAWFTALMRLVLAPSESGPRQLFPVSAPRRSAS